ncbi:MAG: nucleotide exchange factor GrpE, partial [Betaproteobacteria bacterium]
MSDQKQPDPHNSAQEYQSTEELAAAQSAHESDAQSRTQADLAALQAKSAELADQYLRAKAEAENARRRAEDEIAKSRKFAIEAF